MEILQVFKRRRIWPCLQGPPIRISTDDFFYISTASHRRFVDRHCSACRRLWHASPPQRLLYPRSNPGIQQLPRLSAGIDPGVYVWQREHHYQKKAQGMVITSGITCLAAVASLGLLGLLANRCDWPEIILVSRGLFLKPLSDVASWRLSQHGLTQYRGPRCKSGILFRECPMCKMLKAYTLVPSLL